MCSRTYLENKIISCIRNYKRLLSISEKMTLFPCIVCSKPYDGTTHCSVMACRACAMFFKRCENLKVVRICKRRNNCMPDDSGRFPCTACRYQRCIRVVMKRQENARSLTSVTKHLEVATVNKNFLKLNIDLHALVPETMPTLKRFCYHYALKSNAQRAHELMILREDGEELTVLPNNKKMGYMTQTRSNRLYAIGLSGFVAFIKNSFPAFTSMDNHAQDTVIHLLMIFYFDLFSSFNTYRTFNDVNTTKMVCSEVMFADLKNIQNFLDDQAVPDPMDNKMIRNYFSTSWLQYLKCTLHRIKLTDVEFLAVSALIIWEEENFIQLPHLNKMAEKHRQMVYKDLDYYYKNILHMDNYVERILNIHELIRTLKRNLFAMVDSVHVLKMFNFYKQNKEMWKATEKVVGILEHRSR